MEKDLYRLFMAAEEDVKYGVPEESIRLDLSRISSKRISQSKKPIKVFKIRFKKESK